MKYTTLFDCSIFHDYFQSRKCPAISVIPSMATNRVLRQYQLRFQYKENKAVVVMPSFDSKKNLLQEEKNKIRLLFHLQISDALFFNYTHLPLEDLNEQIYVFQNRTDETRLTKDEFVFTSDQLTYQPKQFSFQLGASQEGVLLIENFNKEVIEEMQLIENQKETHVNLSNESSGIYTLKIKDTDDGQDFFVANKQPFGVIIIEIDPEHWFAEETYQAKNYHLAFEKRSTYWRYNIINNIEYPLENFSITSTQNEISFTAEAEDRILGNGINAACFISNEAIALSEYQNEKFSLQMNKKTNGGHNSIAKTIPLPKANIKQIKPIKYKEEHRIISDIYVQL